MEPTPPRRPPRRRHVAARSRAVAVVGSVAACLGLTWGFAHQNLGASTQASSPATTAPPQQGAGRGDGGYGYLTQPIPDYGAVPGQSGGGANTTSGGS